MMTYTRRDIAFMAYFFGLLTGMIVAFAACTPPEQPVDHQTSIGAEQ